MSQPFDPSRYTSRPPAITVQTGIALARALAAAVPAGMPEAISRSGQGLAALADEIEGKAGERQRQEVDPAGDDGPVLDLEADRSWSGLRDRLEGYSKLPPERFPDARRADELLDLLFGAEGLGFLRESYPEQWTAMGGLLRRIDNEGLAADIDRVAGPEFLTAVRDVQVRYGQMVHASFQRPAVAPNLVAERVRLAQAIVEHAIKVVATIDRGDPATLERARAALRPIDIHRERNRRSAPRGGGGGGNEGPSGG